MSIKPILFNTEMVRALLDGRKTVTRRVVKCRKGFTVVEIPKWVTECTADDSEDGVPSVPFTVKSNANGCLTVEEIPAPCRPGDILYVRETWAQVNESIGMGLKCKKYIYRANYSDTEAKGWKWRPSINMPREAVRIFLRVTDVRVERLRDIDADGCIKEGIPWQEVIPYVGALPDNPAVDMDAVVGNAQRMEEQKLVEESFSRLWDDTIKPADRERYGWAANPWVWVIAFERCEKPEEG